MTHVERTGEAPTLHRTSWQHLTPDMQAQGGKLWRERVSEAELLRHSVDLEGTQAEDVLFVDNPQDMPVLLTNFEKAEQSLRRNYLFSTQRFPNNTSRYPACIYLPVEVTLSTGVVPAFALIRPGFVTEQAYLLGRSNFINEVNVQLHGANRKDLAIPSPISPPHVNGRKNA